MYARDMWGEHDVATPIILPSPSLKPMCVFGCFITGTVVSGAHQTGWFTVDGSVKPLLNFLKGRK